jgi:DNA topoisomerase-3
MRLFICEKPSQAKDIAKHVGARQSGQGCITGAGVTVTWCFGHLLEQASPEFYQPELKIWNLDYLPVVPQQWQMHVKASCKDQYRVIAGLLKTATDVIVATDADREGEVIAREVMQLAGYRGPVSRLWLGALDDASVKKALAKPLPGAKTLPLYFSGMGRARADWLAGMNITMALTKAYGAGGKGGYSAPT